MHIFIDKLNMQDAVLQEAIGLLRILSRELKLAKRNGHPSASDLRITIHSLQQIFEDQHQKLVEATAYVLLKQVPPADILPNTHERLIDDHKTRFERCRHLLLTLRAAIDHYESDYSQRKFLEWQLADLTENFENHLLREKNELIKPLQRICQLRPEICSAMDQNQAKNADPETERFGHIITHVRKIFEDLTSRYSLELVNRRQS